MIHRSWLTPGQRLALVLLSAATLAFEITLTRLFAVAQFYHFAFMVVSLALLGFGASGTLLSLAPPLRRLVPPVLLAATGLMFAFTTLGAYLLTNYVPFDSFTIAWERRQVLILALHVVVLSLPFLSSGLAVGALLSQAPARAGPTYALNLAGAALGCVLALLLPAYLGGEDMVLFSAWLGALAAACALFKRGRFQTLLIFTGLILGVTTLLVLRRPALFDLHLSPYKGLRYALQYPGARLILQRWNAYSRVDVVESPGIRALPGLSYRFSGSPPPQWGLFVDGDDLSPVVLENSNGDSPDDYAKHMPLTAAFLLRPGARTLVLEPRGGLDIVLARTLGAREVWAVEANPLIVNAAAHVYQADGVHTVLESNRSFLRRRAEQFDLVIITLTSAYHPIRSGAYSLAEDYRYTVEALREALEHLTPDGILVLTRWLQTPPSEWLRAFILAVEAVDAMGGNPAAQIVAFRGYNTGTLLVKRQPFRPEEVDALRAFLDERAFDLAWAPGMVPEEANRHNILPEPAYYQAFRDLLTTSNREQWYATYPFDVHPPTDDHPFFGHYFRWSQARQVWAELGKTWQPFGGAGYFVLVALLVLTAVLATALILLPLAVGERRVFREGQLPRRYPLLYFAALGVGYLFVEIPLIQRFILYLGQPAYAFTVVLFALLLFSGVGSHVAGQGRPARVLPILLLLVVITSVGLPLLFRATLGWSLPARMVVAVASLAPVGMSMGTPFPRAIRQLERDAAGWVPWAWGINGAVSVVASPGAALLALTLGFRAVLLAGALAYAGAWLTARAWAAHSAAPSPPPGR